VASATVFLNEFQAVTRRVALDLWRSRRRAEAFGEIMDDRHVQLPNPVEPVEQAITAVDVRAALDGLSQEHRAVITEMYMNQHSAVETAEILGIPVGAVKSRSYYALRALRETIFGFSADTPATAS
jgi:RNA polymerase sigma-70 factor (ECF subfamily)